MDLKYIAADKSDTSAGPVRLGNGVLLESSNYNFFSLSMLLNNGRKIQSDASKALMNIGSEALTLDIVISSTKGALFYACFERGRADFAGANAGHVNEKATRAMALRLGWHIHIGKMKLCKQCTISYRQGEAT